MDRRCKQPYLLSTPPGARTRVLRAANHTDRHAYCHRHTDRHTDTGTHTATDIQIDIQTLTHTHRERVRGPSNQSNYVVGHHLPPRRMFPVRTSQCTTSASSCKYRNPAATPRSIAAALEGGSPQCLCCAIALACRLFELSMSPCVMTSSVE